MRVNRRQLADILGITQPTVTAWCDQGMPSLVQGSKGVEWAFETKDCIDWFARNKVKQRERGPAPGEDPFAETGVGRETVEEASRRKEIAHADRAEIMVAKEATLLVPIDEVAAVVAEENARARTRILSIPNEIRPKVLTFLQNDRRAAEQLLTDVEDVIKEAMAEIRSWAPDHEPDEIQPEPAAEDEGDASPDG